MVTESGLIVSYLGATGMQISDLGEQGLLAHLQRFCPPEIVGDDAALLLPTLGQALVVTTDMLVAGTHFSDQTTAPGDVGWRGAAANLSDLAAMGATPLGLTVALGLPGDLSLDWVLDLYAGLTECLQRHQTVLVGGDICRSAQITLGITALGQVEPQRAIRRSTAQVGDVIVATGIHGASRAGLELLLNPTWGPTLSPEDRQDLIRAHQRPRPRLDVVQWLRQQFPEQRVTGMDSSDGLADAVLQISRASGVGAQVFQAQLPVPKSFAAIADLTPAQGLDWVLYGGEDFELVLCLELTMARALVAAFPDAAIIGEVVTGADAVPEVVPEVVLVTGAGTSPLSLAQGFQHFA